MSSNSSQQAAGKASRWVLPTLVLLFFGPLLTAGYVYYFGGGWRPATSVNYGRLLDAPLVLAELEPPTAGAGENRSGLFKGSWTLLYLSDQDCGTECLAALDKMRRVRLALREKAVRVQRVLLYVRAPATDPLAAGDQADLHVVVSGGEGAALVQQLADVSGTPANAPGTVFLVDPLGNLIMAYEPGFEMKGMLADLKRLLRLSSIG